jgi:hypothetical protein
MKRIQVYIDHDIIVRHFIHSGVLSELEKGFKVQYVFPENHKRVTTAIDSLGLKSLVTIPIDSPRSGMLRELAKIRSLKIARSNQSYKFVQTAWRRFFGYRIYIRMWIKSLPIVYNWYSRQIINKAGRNVPLESAIDNYRPDIILHPTVLDGLFISDLAMITNERNIPFVALMNSWDNPSTKAQTIRPPDWLCVWGEQTRQHAVEFLGIPPDRIRIMGAAQFEVYREPVSVSREELCRLMGIDPAKKLILYAGRAVEEDALKNCHIIFRPHPWRAPGEDEPDFYDIAWKYVSMDPSMKSFYRSPKNKGQSGMNLTDYRDTHNILSAIDLLVSNMSTILLEAALHGKPVLCMISDKDMENNDFINVTVNAIYFKELLERMEIPRCRDMNKIAAYCTQQLDLASSAEFERLQSEKIRFFVEMGDNPYSVKLRNFIEETLAA